MSDAAAQAHPHPPAHYLRIWLILLGLLAISIIGPMIGIRFITLVTAFGIAIVKAYLVCAHFMHLNIERRYVVYLLASALAMMALLYVGVAPDVMEHQGQNWENVSAKAERARRAASEAAIP